MTSGMTDRGERRPQGRRRGEEGALAPRGRGPRRHYRSALQSD